jgi:hypothetical protein
VLDVITHNNSSEAAAFMEESAALPKSKKKKQKEEAKQSASTGESGGARGSGGNSIDQLPSLPRRRFDWNIYPPKLYYVLSALDEITAAIRVFNNVEVQDPPCMMNLHKSVAKMLGEVCQTLDDKRTQIIASTKSMADVPSLATAIGQAAAANYNCKVKVQTK